MTYRAREMIVRAGRFVGGLKAASAGFSVGVPVKFPWGCCSTDQGVCANDSINELYQKGPLAPYPSGAQVGAQVGA